MVKVLIRLIVAFCFCVPAHVWGMEKNPFEQLLKDDKIQSELKNQSKERLPKIFDQIGELKIQSITKQIANSEQGKAIVAKIVALRDTIIIGSGVSEATKREKESAAFFKSLEAIHKNILDGTLGFVDVKISKKLAEVENVKNNFDLLMAEINKLKVLVDVQLSIVTDEFNKQFVQYGESESVKQFPALHQGYRYAFNPYIKGIPGTLDPLGMKNSTNLCGWYSVFFLNAMFRMLGNIDRLKNFINDRHKLDGFLGALVNEGKPFSHLRKNGLEDDQLAGEKKVRREINKIIEGKDGTMTMLRADRLANIAQHVLGRPVLTIGEHEKELLNWATFSPLYEQNQNAVEEGRFDDLKEIKLSVHSIDNIEVTNNFPVIIFVGSDYATSPGHWIAGIFVVGKENKLYIADSLGSDRTKDKIVEKVFNKLNDMYKKRVSGASEGDRLREVQEEQRRRDLMEQQARQMKLEDEQKRRIEIEKRWLEYYAQMAQEKKAMDSLLRDRPGDPLQVLSTQLTKLKLWLGTLSHQLKTLSQVGL